MNIENHIEAQYRELVSFTQLNGEYIALYKSVKHARLQEMFATLHHELVVSFRSMNERLPTGENEAHFWAEPSRELIKTIDIISSLYGVLKETALAFEIDEYYSDLIAKCRTFLSSSGGSRIPPHMARVELYYTIPIFKPLTSVTVSHSQNELSFSLKQIGTGSYANVFKYRDAFYNRNFVVKRAKKDLNDKELARFMREFEVMRDFSSPYILEVFCYNSDKNEYIMEYMDYTLDEYISKYNASLSMQQRKGIVQQILRAFDYIHAKGHLHRDISPKNILVKEYDDIVVIKIADFGLVKIPDSSFTSVNTEFKGYFNDPALVVEGFNSYNILHETYALTRIVFYVMTGRTNVDRIKDRTLYEFVQKGLSADKHKRFQSVAEISAAFRRV